MKIQDNIYFKEELDAVEEKGIEITNTEHS